MRKKKMDAIVANDVSHHGIGFDSDLNAVTIITPAEVIEVPTASKREVAGRILDSVKSLRTRKLDSVETGAPARSGDAKHR